MVSGSPLQGLRMVFEGKIVSYDMIKDAFQAAAAHLFRVEGLEGARGSVAGVGKGSVPYIRTFLVQGVEGREGHVDLAPYLKVPGHVPDVGRYGGDGPDILGNIVPYGSVPPREGPHELPPGITEADGSAVELQLAVVGEFLPGGFPDPPVEILQFFYIIGIAQRKHGPSVAVLAELPGTRSPSCNIAAHSHGGRVGRSQLRIHLLDGGQLHHHDVVFEIRYLGIVEHVIPVVVPVELLAEEFGSFLGLFFRYLFISHRSGY